jgi:hypothetical protein
MVCFSRLMTLSNIMIYASRSSSADPLFTSCHPGSGDLKTAPQSACASMRSLDLTFDTHCLFAHLVPVLVFESRLVHESLIYEIDELFHRSHSLCPDTRCSVAMRMPLSLSMSSRQSSMNKIYTPMMSAYYVSVANFFPVSRTKDLLMPTRAGLFNCSTSYTMREVRKSSISIGICYGISSPLWTET